MIDRGDEQDDARPLTACLSPASFWAPNLLLPESAWLEHAPLAFWLIDVLRPKLVVELGCHSGFSFFAFCQAVQSLQLKARCYGIDHWKGDEHTERTGDEVFAGANSYNELHFSSFARLVRSEFSEATAHFDPQSIDLLHIDGSHSFDAVKSDYEHWRSRVSTGGIVLFHAINVRERGCGVWKLWEELAGDHSHFSFLHGQGLGVLGIGERFPDPLEMFFGYAANAEAATTIQSAYGRLGLALRARVTAEKLAARLLSVETEALELARQTRRQNYLSAVIAERDGEIERLRTEHGVELERLHSEHGIEIARLRSEHGVAIERLHDESNRIFNEREAEIKRLKRSFSWRLTAPLREVARGLGRMRSARPKH